uniref:Leucine-rich repeat-containing protein 9 n=1 Tax=Gongylonema pulchrum TaxID=637853 RepID=A0A183EJF2_9BILA
LSDVCVLGLVFDINHDESDGSSDSFLTVTFNSALKIANINDFLILTLKNGQRWTPTAVAVLISLTSNNFKFSRMAQLTTGVNPILQDEDLSWPDTKMGSRCDISYKFKIIGEIAECAVRPSISEPYRVVNLSEGYVNFDEIYHFYHIKRKPIAESRREIIEKFMDNCEKLLKELEFERKKETMKWPLYMYTLTLLELKPVEMHEEILHNLELLAKEIDAQRCGMYEDMARNLQINEKLRQKFGNGLLIDTLFKKTDDGPPVGELNLENMGLKSIEHLKYLSSFIVRLNLSGNRFTDVQHFKSFRRLTHLVLDRNPLSRFSFFHIGIFYGIITSLLLHLPFTLLPLQQLEQNWFLCRDYDNCEKHFYLILIFRSL